MPLVNTRHICSIRCGTLQEEVAHTCSIEILGLEKSQFKNAET
jgi:hypothetical protein